jgi:hypothetical protein
MRSAALSHHGRARPGAGVHDPGPAGAGQVGPGPLVLGRSSSHCRPGRGFWFPVRAERCSDSCRRGPCENAGRWSQSPRRQRPFLGRVRRPDPQGLPCAAGRKVPSEGFPVTFLHSFASRKPLSSDERHFLFFTITSGGLGLRFVPGRGGGVKSRLQGFSRGNGLLGKAADFFLGSDSQCILKM